MSRLEASKAPQSCKQAVLGWVQATVKRASSWHALNPKPKTPATLNPKPYTRSPAWSSLREAALASARFSGSFGVRDLGLGIWV